MNQTWMKVLAITAGVLAIVGLIVLIIHFTNKGGSGPGPRHKPKPFKPKPFKPKPLPSADNTKIQAYLQSVYPTSDKIAKFTDKEASAYYKNLWFYYLVLDWLGTPSTIQTKGKTITIKGTLMPITDLVPNEYADGAPFLHPNSVVIKDAAKVFYPKSGKSGTSAAIMLKTLSNGKYLEVSSFGWNAYPSGIYLNTAIGSGIFWDPGNIAVGPNKVALIYMFACKLEKVNYTENIFTQSGYTAFNNALKTYDRGAAINRVLQEIQKGTNSRSIQEVVKFHVMDNRQFLSQKLVVADEAVSSYDNPLQKMGLACKYDSCMMAAQANGNGSFDIELCDFRVTIQGAFGNGTINDDIRGKWELFQSKYMSIRDPWM